MAGAQKRKHGTAKKRKTPYDPEGTKAMGAGGGNTKPKKKMTRKAGKATNR